MANKFGNTKVTIDNIRFDSRKEGRRYTDLKLAQRAGVIRDLKVQPRFKFIVKPWRDGQTPALVHVGSRRTVIYTADFQYFDIENDREVVEDVKSKATKTEAYKLRRALMLWINGIEVEEYG